MANDSAASEFLAARDLLFKHREDLDAACREFVWPRPAHFNWALDYFDPMAADNDRLALWIVDEGGSQKCLGTIQLRLLVHLTDQGGNECLKIFGSSHEVGFTVDFNHGCNLAISTDLGAD